MHSAPNGLRQRLEQGEEPIAAQDGERDGHLIRIQLPRDVQGDVVQGDDVALGPRQEGFRHRDDVPVPQGKGSVGGVRRLDQALRHNPHQVVPTLDDGQPNPMGLNPNLTPLPLTPASFQAVLLCHFQPPDAAVPASVRGTAEFDTVFFLL